MRPIKYIIPITIILFITLAGFLFYDVVIRSCDIGSCDIKSNNVRANCNCESTNNNICTKFCNCESKNNNICKKFCLIYKAHKYSALFLFVATLINLKRINFSIKTIAILTELFVFIKSEDSTIYDCIGIAIGFLSIAIDLYRNYPKQFWFWRKCDGNILIIHSSAGQNNPNKIALGLACKMTNRQFDYSGPPNAEDKKPDGKFIWTSDKFEHIYLDGCYKNVIHRFFLALLAKTKFSPEATDVAAVEDWLQFLRLYDSRNPQQFLNEFDKKLSSQQSPISQQQNEQQPAAGFKQTIINAFSNINCSINCCSTVAHTTNNSNDSPYIVGDKISALDILAAIEFNAAKNQLSSETFSDENGTDSISKKWFDKVLLAKIAYAQGFIDAHDICGKSQKLAEMLPEQSFIRETSSSNPPQQQLGTHSNPQQHQLGGTHSNPSQQQLGTHSNPPQQQLGTHSNPPQQQLGTHSNPPQQQLGTHSNPSQQQLGTHSNPQQHQLGGTHSNPSQQQLGTQSNPQQHQLGGTHSNPSQQQLGTHSNPPQQQLGTHSNPPQQQLGTHSNPPQQQLGTHSNPSQQQLGTHSNPSQQQLGTHSNPSHQQLGTHSNPPQQQLGSHGQVIYHSQSGDVYIQHK